MPKISQAEVTSAVKQAAYEHAKPPSGTRAGTETLTNVQRLAKAGRERIAAGDQRGVLREYQSARKVPDKGSLRTEQHIGTKQPDGTIVKSPEEIRFAEVEKNARELVNNFAQKGFEGLTPDQKKRAVADVRAVMLKDPQNRSLLEAKGDAAFDVEVEKHLNNSAFLEKVRERAANGRDLNLALSDAVTDARIDLKARETDLRKTQRELRAAKEAKADNGVKLDQFEDRTPTGGRKGSKVEELQELTNQFSALENTVATKVDEIDLLQSELADMKSQTGRFWGEGAVTPDAIRQKQEDIRTARSQLKEAQTKIDRKKALEKEKLDLRAERNELDEKIDEFEDLEVEQTRLSEIAKREAESAERNWVEHESEVVYDLDRTISESAADLFEDRIRAAETGALEQYQAELEAAQQLPDRAFATGLHDIYARLPARKVKGFLGREKWQLGGYPVDIINNHMNRVLAGEDPKFLVEDYLARGKDPTNGNRMTADEIAQQMQNEEWMQAATTKAMESLITVKIKSGGLTADEAAVLRDSKWGEFVILNNAAKSPDALALLDAVKAKTGAESDEDALKQMDKKTLLLLLLEIVGGMMEEAAKGTKVSETLQQAA